MFQECTEGSQQAHRGMIWNFGFFKAVWSPGERRDSTSHHEEFMKLNAGEMCVQIGVFLIY